VDHSTERSLLVDTTDCAAGPWGEGTLARDKGTVNVVRLKVARCA
jgi:hypothetical protein